MSSENRLKLVKTRCPQRGHQALGPREVRVQTPSLHLPWRLYRVSRRYGIKLVTFFPEKFLNEEQKLVDLGQPFFLGYFQPYFCHQSYNVIDNFSDAHFRVFPILNVWTTKLWTLLTLFYTPRINPTCTVDSASKSILPPASSRRSIVLRLFNRPRLGSVFQCGRRG